MRTFSEEEARAVFAQAAREAPATDDLRGERLTLDELVEIGRASGLDAERVALAATTLGATGAPAPRAATIAGIPAEVVRTRAIPGPLTDDLWEETVDAARMLFGGPGTAEHIGRVRQWAAPASAGWGGGRLQTRVTARPRGDGTTSIRIEREGQRSNVRDMIGSVGFLGLMSFLPLFGLGGVEEGLGPLWFALVMLALSVALGVAGFVGLRRGAASHAARFEAALDRIDLMARREAALPEARTFDAGASVATGRLDLSALDEAPEAEPLLTSRTRTR